jgi:alkylation response protein AidB-like acyl-CoA dehydrogenase
MTTTTDLTTTDAAGTATDHTTGATPAHTSATDWIAIAEALGAELAPGVRDRDRTGELSTDAFDRFRVSGLTSALVPAELGGGGATHADLAAVLRTLGRDDGPTAVALAMHTHVVATQVWRHLHGMDATKVLRKVADDHAVLVSTGASDWVGSNGQARAVDGGYVVSARKTPVSACEVGDVLVTSIRWDEAPDGPQVLHCSVPLAADGVQIERTWDTLGMRATGSHTVVLDDVFVPDGAVSLARSADTWAPIWNIVLGSAMPLIMSAYLGVADAAVDLVRDGGTTGDAHEHQVVGEMMNAHTTADDVITAMISSADNLQFANTNAHAAATLSRKTVATRALVDTVDLALEATGGRGYLRSSDLERLHRDVFGAQFHPLPRAKQTRFTGRVAMGLSPV